MQAKCQMADHGDNILRALRLLRRETGWVISIPIPTTLIIIIGSSNQMFALGFGSFFFGAIEKTKANGQTRFLLSLSRRFQFEENCENINNLK